MSLSLYLDHHVNDAISLALRQKGMKVITAREDGYSRSSDRVMLERASSLSAVLVTYDADFLELAAQFQSEGVVFGGIIFCRSRGHSLGDTIRDIEMIASVLSADEIVSTVVWIPL